MLQKLFRFNLYKIVPVLFLLGLFFILQNFNNRTVEAQTSPDAIAIRVMPNQEHYSISRWYSENFGGTGSPQLSTVDGYEAIRDGRSVYVNVSNVSSTNVLFTNVYLISFNQDAEAATEDIFGKILANWKFNTNKNIYGLCRKDGSISCLSDSDCPINDYCASAKARIVRDTKRLSDISEIKFLLEDYKLSNSVYPVLNSGTFIPNNTLSVWPSWRGVLSEKLSSSLPTDPVNKLGPCTGYDELTCWNESSLSFASALPSLPTNSLVYRYLTNSAGTTLSVCAVFESGLIISGGSNIGTCADVCLDFDSDGYGSPASSACPRSGYDCNDSDSAITTGGVEDCFNGSDDDCDGYIDCYDSADCSTEPICSGAFICDNDGICESGETCALCGGADNCCTCGNGICETALGECSTCYGAGMDCSCGDSVVCTAALEGCDDGNTVSGDGCNSSCTVEVTTCFDNDGDGFRGHTIACPTGTDCDDNTSGCGSACYPGATEICDGYDNNCDSTVDNGAGMTEENCVFICNSLSAAYDFNPSRPGVYACCGDDNNGTTTFEADPYQSSELLCSDGQDNDCDGTVDSADTDCGAACANTNERNYVNMLNPASCDQCGILGDSDGDQPGTWAPFTLMIDACDSDCGIVSATVQRANFQNGIETLCDGIDNNCDGNIDESLSNTFYRDSDSDTYGDPSVTVTGCVAPTGYVTNDDDCNDSSAVVHPGVTEICGNAFDDNCNGSVNEGCATCYRDNDGDTYGDLSTTLVMASCTGGYVSNFSDCNDSNNAINPAATELCGNTVDENCAGGLNDGCINCYRDSDSDTYGNPAVVSQFAIVCPGTGNYVSNNTDCNDGSAFIYPGATETCDGNNNDCDAQTDEGCDDDGDHYCDNTMPMYNNNSMCTLTTIYTFPLNNGSLGNDCNDTLASVHPGGTEICQDGVDQDCVGGDLSCAGICDDADGDREIAQTTALSLCGPVCGPLKNQNCVANNDCDDTNANMYHANAENCTDSLDNNCNGDVDCADSACPPCMNPCVFNPTAFDLSCMFNL